MLIKHRNIIVILFSFFQVDLEKAGEEQQLLEMSFLQSEVDKE